MTSWPLKMEPAGCPETSAWNYHSALRNIPEQRRGSDKSLARPWKETSYSDQDLQHYTKTYGVKTTGICSYCLDAISLGRCSLFPSRVGLRTYQNPCTQRPKHRIKHFTFLMYVVTNVDVFTVNFWELCWGEYFWNSGSNLYWRGVIICNFHVVLVPKPAEIEWKYSSTQFTPPPPFSERAFLLKVFRLLPFVILLRAACRRSWVWSNGGVIQTGDGPIWRLRLTRIMFKVPVRTAQ